MRTTRAQIEKMAEQELAGIDHDLADMQAAIGTVQMRLQKAADKAGVQWTYHGSDFVTLEGADAADPPARPKGW